MDPGFGASRSVSNEGHWCLYNLFSRCGPTANSDRMIHNATTDDKVALTPSDGCCFPPLTVSGVSLCAAYGAYPVALLHPCDPLQSLVRLMCLNMAVQELVQHSRRDNPGEAPAPPMCCGTG
ncbi:hypothetical protein NDU88_005963 [Pleurodeles waltl]|uniref:Uncharacterized protein n=1 Tax=Pleurodeles waltl TaxID=8319 RepID=A0AAV7UJM7_PLEWA|nr:hypothetical protein NDU88_005963 [Pleurodeles waltl]